MAMSVDDNNLLSYVRQNLASTFEEMGEKDSCLLYARQAYDLNGNDRFSCQLMLASVYISVDSIKQAFAILKQTTPKQQKIIILCFILEAKLLRKPKIIRWLKPLVILHVVTCKKCTEQHPKPRFPIILLF